MNDSMNKNGGSNPAANRNQAERARLFRLPTLPPRALQYETSQVTTPAACVNCRKSLKNESEFAERVKVCAACLQTFAVIEAALNTSAEQKVRAAKLKEFSAKLNF